MPDETRRSADPNAQIAGGWLLLCGLALLLVGTDFGTPGLYYDEVIQAEPAVQFLLDDGRPSEIPGLRSVRMFGGWLPWMTQGYMGALKSQLLIPVFALVDADAVALRTTTWCWALAGIGFAMLWVRAFAGVTAALFVGLLLATDPSVLFVGRHDWGSFSLSLALRCAAAWLAVTGAAAALTSTEAEAPERFAPKPTGLAGLARLAGAGLCAGAALYNKVDAAIFFAAVIPAACLCLPAAQRRALPRARVAVAVAAACIGVAVGAAPLMAALPDVLSSTDALVRGADIDLGEKLRTLVATLDGSYFPRLLHAGGSFDEMYAGRPPAASPAAAAFAASWIFLAIRWLRQGASPEVRFAVLAASLGIVCLLLTPGAVRVHHALNLAPLPHLVSALAARELFALGRGPRGSAAARWIAVAGVALTVIGGAAVAVSTRASLAETGGKGRWSGALGNFGAALAATPGASVICLDWGFAGPLRFQARALEVVEPFWRLRGPAGAHRAWSHAGLPGHAYLVQPRRLEVFPFGAEFLDAVALLPPGSAKLVRHRDGDGDLAFLEVRLSGHHQITYRRGFEIVLR